MAVNTACMLLLIAIEVLAHVALSSSWAPSCRPLLCRPLQLSRHSRNVRRRQRHGMLLPARRQRQRAPSCRRSARRAPTSPQSGAAHLRGEFGSCWQPAPSTDARQTRRSQCKARRCADTPCLVSLAPFVQAAGVQQRALPLCCGGVMRPCHAQPAQDSHLFVCTCACACALAAHHAASLTQWR